MAKSSYQQTIVNNATGLVVPNATVTIRRESDNGLASLWLDRAGITPQSNPFTANEEGFYRVYLDSGRYRITATAVGLAAEPIRDYLIFSEDLVNIGDISSFILEQASAAAAYRDEAREWAIADEFEPVGGSPGLHSSFHYAMQSQAFASDAEQWANNDFGVPVSGSPAAFSAKHWAEQAAENALADPDIAEAIDNATTASAIDDDYKFLVGVPESPLSLVTVSWALIKTTLLALTNFITNAMLANMAQATIKGRASGAGTGAPTDLSASQVLAILGFNIPVNVTPVSLLSAGSTVEIATGIPSWVNHVDVMLTGVTLSGTDNILVQFGNATSYETSGYVSSTSSIPDSADPTVASSTSGFIIRHAGTSDTINGCYTFSRATGNTWVGKGGFHREGTTRQITASGRRAMSATLTRIQITVTGSNTYNLGTGSVAYRQ